jgi:MarR family transcriptional regulator for hemolysin
MAATTEQLGPALAEAARAWRARLDERLRPLGLSQARWIILLQLSRHGDGVAQKVLAGRVGIEGPTLVRLLDRMTEDGWLERRESAEDRRCKTVHLTDKARDVIEEIRKVATSLRTELLAGTTAEELDTALRVLQHIKDKADRQHGGGEN